MIRSDRILGLVTVGVALAFIASATQIETSFLSDPVGSKTFPYGIGAVALVCGLFFLLRPDPDPEWPPARNWLSLGVAAVVLVLYAYALKPFGFLVPTVVVGAILSFQIRPRAVPALLAGCGLAVGLFIVFKFLLGLSLFAFPRWLGWF